MNIKYVIPTWYLVADLIGIFNSDSRKSVFKFSGLNSSLPLKIYTMERDHYKQAKLARNIKI